METTTLNRPTKRTKLLLATSNTILQHLLDLGCERVPESQKIYFHAWEVTLATTGGLLTISVSNSDLLPDNTGSIMVHGRFDTPELFPAGFCSYNGINPYTRKYNHYIQASNPAELNNLLAYFSRIIPILEAE